MEVYKTLFLIVYFSSVIESGVAINLLYTKNNMPINITISVMFVFCEKKPSFDFVAGSMCKFSCVLNKISIID